MASTLHPNGSVSSVVALGIARQAAENSISVGATTTDIAEGTRLYFTTARARNSINAVAPITYDNMNGTIGANIAISNVNGLTTALDGKSNTGHIHTISNIGGLQTALDSKEPLIAIKNSAFNKNFGNTVDTVCQGNDSRLSDSRAPLSHTHSISDVTGLQTELDSKQDTISGYSGTITVITGVNFSNNTTTSKTITISNGIITNVV